MIYDKLPDWFVAYDIFDYEKIHFIDSVKADNILRDCGFDVIPISFYGESIPPKPLTYEFFEEIANCPTWFANDSQREGIVVKISNGEWITDRFKMVRQGFEQGCLLGKTLKRNKLA